MTAEDIKQGCYTPNENDKALIKDAMMGFTAFTPHRGAYE